MNKLIFSLLIIPIVLTNVYAIEPDVEIYCPSTQIAVDGKCQPVNYINPLYYFGGVIAVIGIISVIFLIKKKQKTNLLE